MKDPPRFTDNLQTYRQLVETWSVVTPLEKDKQGGALLLSLTGKPLEYCLGTPNDKLFSDKGVAAILDTLENLYSSTQHSAFSLFGGFDRLQRDKDEPILAFIQRFEAQISKMSEFDIKLPNSVHAYQFLKGANLTDTL